ncbi:MAG TPA: glycerophosphodiester phosphodiesterase family protein [Jatrophihabitantaceae bacterium]
MSRRATHEVRTRPQRPLVVAHRGASFDVAEHTLAAYTAAIESGADALECDVRLSRDGHLVCVHDRRVDRTSDGRGLVSELDLAGLNSLDFSSWHEAQDWPDTADHLLRDEPYLAGVAPDRVPGGGVLTIERLLGLVHDASRPVRLLIETKHPTRYGGLVEKELVKMLARFGWAGQPGPVSSIRGRPVEPSAGRATVMSFAPIALRRVRLLAPEVPTVLLLERRLLPGRRDGSLPSGVGIAGPGLATIRAHPGFVARAHAKGNAVYVWTVDEPADVRFVLDLGVDAVITNRPADVIAQLDS